jgi:hypothetical protein
MSHDGLPVRVGDDVHAANADRRASACGRLSLLRRALPAAALTAATALVFAACSTGAGSSSAVGSTGPLSSTAASTGASSEASGSTEASAAASGGPLAVIFQPVNGSQVLGGAVLTDQADGTATVEIGIGSTGATDGMPAVLQQGSCADAAGASGSPSSSGLPAASGAPSASEAPMASAAASAAPASAGASAGASAAAGGSAAPSGSGEAASPSASPVSGPPFQLTPLAGGASTTVIATTTSALLAEPFSIVIHGSATDASVVACADISTTSVRVPTASSLASMLPSALPSLGTEASPSGS